MSHFDDPNVYTDVYAESSSSVALSDKIEISAEKNQVKSGGWLAKFVAFDSDPKFAAFTTASAAKQWLVDQFNEYSGEDRKRLPWKKNSEFLITANATMSARGKINFDK